MSRLSCTGRLRSFVRVLSATLALSGGVVPALAKAEVQVAPGLRVEMVATGIPRPIALSFDRAGRLIVLSHGWRGDAAAEIYRLDLGAPFPLDASRAPRVVIPFAEGPRKTAFGSLAIDPRSGDLFLGEENGNRIYRLTPDEKLTLFAVGLQHLVGGSSLAFDRNGRLVGLDFASTESQLRSETPPPPALDWLQSEGYHGPLILRVDPTEDVPLPRRLDLLPPLFPKGWIRSVQGDYVPRFISVAVAVSGDLLLLGSNGAIFTLTSGGRLHLLAQLPAGHYHRTNMAVAPDGSVFVSSGFHLRQVFRISPAGDVTSIVRELGDPAGITVDPAGNLYVAETALHRIIRISPLP